MERKHLSLRLLGIILCALQACASSCGGTSTGTRASIQGRVELVGIAGLNDMSRVRVDLGRGEGGVAPAEDGEFEISDVEPDVYTLSVVYSGGLTPTATRSAYKRYEARVRATSGSVTNLGVIRLTLATGTVTGSVDQTDNEPADGATVTLQTADGQTLSTTVENGTFTLTEVPVGVHSVEVTKSGYATPAAQTACAPAVTVGEEGEEVTVEGLGLAATRARLSSGQDEAREEGSTWHVSRSFTAVTVKVDSAYARRGRWWKAGEDAPGYDLTPPDGFHLEDIPEGRTEYVFQFSDGCSYESPLYSLFLVRDLAAPVVESFTVEGGNAGTSSRNVAVRMAARDLLADTLEMRMTACAVDGETVTCNPALDQVTTWEPLALQRTFTLEDRDGVHELQLQVRDPAGNESDVAEARITLDRVAPTGTLGIQGTGTGMTRDPAVTLTLTAGDDVASVAVINGSATGCASAVYGAPFTEQTWLLLGSDGEKTVTACLRDVAGNTGSAEASITLDATAPGAPAVTINGGASYATSALLDLTLGATGDVVEMDLSEDPGFTAPLATAYATTAQLTLTGDDGLRAVYARFRDVAGNTSGTASAFITLDRAPPTLTSVTIIGRNADGTDNLAVTSSLQVELLVEGADADLMAVGTSTLDCGLAGYTRAFAPVVPFTLDAAGTVSVCLKDLAGNTVGPVDASIEVDQTSPSCTITLSGFMADGVTDAPAGKSAVTTVKVTSSSCSGGDSLTGAPVGIALAPEGAALSCATASYGTFAETSYVTVPAGNGTRNVQACFKDAVGNVTPSPVTASSALTLDQTPPQSVVLELNRESARPASWNRSDVYATATPSYDVPASLAASENGTYHLSLSPDFSVAVTGSYTPGTPGSFTTGTITVGSTEGVAQTVYLKVVDELGNASTVVSDVITVDITPPDASAGLINGGDAFTGSVSVSLRNNATDAVEMAFALGQESNFGAYQPYTEYVIYLLDGSLSDGPQDVYFRYRDAAGNETTSTLRASIILDRTAPQTPVLDNTSSVVDLPEGAENVSVTLSTHATDALSSFAAGTLVYEVLGGTLHRGWTPVPGQGPFTFRLKKDAENRLAVRARDGAGNVSAEAAVTYVEDSTEPLAPSDIQVRSGDGKVFISWTASQSTDVVGYKVSYGTTSAFGGTFANEGSSPIDVGLVTQFQLTGVPNGSPIFVAVQAYDAVPLTSAYSGQGRADPNLVTPELRGSYGGTFKDVDYVKRISDGLKYLAGVTDNQLYLYRRTGNTANLQPPPRGDNTPQVIALEAPGYSVEAFDLGSGLVVAVGEEGRVEFFSPDDKDRVHLPAITISLDQRVVDIVRCPGESVLYAALASTDWSTGKILEISLESAVGDLAASNAGLHPRPLQEVSFPAPIRALACDAGGDVTSRGDNTVYVLGGGSSASVLSAYQHSAAGTLQVAAYVDDQANAFHALTRANGMLYAASHGVLRTFPLAGGATDLTGSDLYDFGETGPDFGSLAAQGFNQQHSREVTLAVGSSLAVISGKARTDDRAQVVAVELLGGLPRSSNPARTGQNQPAAVQGSATVTDDGAYAYFAAGTSGVVAVDLVTGALTEVAGAFGSLLAVSYSQGLAWVLTSTRLIVVDASNAHQMRPLASFDFNTPYEVYGDTDRVGALAVSGLSAVVVVQDASVPPGCVRPLYLTLADGNLGGAYHDELQAQPGPCLSTSTDFRLDSLAVHGRELWLSYTEGGTIRLYGARPDEGQESTLESLPGGPRGETVNHQCLVVSDSVVTWCSRADTNGTLRLRTCQHEPGAQISGCRDALVNLSEDARMNTATLRLDGDVLTLSAGTVRRFRYHGQQDGTWSLQPLGEVGSSTTFKTVAAANELYLAGDQREFALSSYDNDRDLAYTLTGAVKDVDINDVVLQGHEVMLGAGERGLVSVSLVTPTTWIPRSTVPQVREGRLATMGHLMVAGDPQAQFTVVDMTAASPTASQVQTARVHVMDVSANGYIAVVFDEDGQRDLVKLYRLQEREITTVGPALHSAPLPVMALDNQQRVWSVTLVGADWTLGYFNFGLQSQLPPFTTLPPSANLGPAQPAQLTVYQDADVGRDLAVAGYTNLLKIYDQASPMGPRVFTATLPANAGTCFDVEVAKNPNAPNLYEVFAVCESPGGELRLGACTYQPLLTGNEVVCEAGTASLGNAPPAATRGNRMVAFPDNSGEGTNPPAYAVALGTAADGRPKLCAWQRNTQERGCEDLATASAGPVSLALLDDPGNSNDNTVFVGLEDGSALRYGLSRPLQAFSAQGQEPVLDGRPVRHGAVAPSTTVGPVYVAGDDLAVSVAGADYGLPLLDRVGWVGRATDVAVWRNRVVTMHPGHGLVLSDYTDVSGGGRLLAHVLAPNVSALAMHDQLLFYAQGNEARMVDATEPSALPASVSLTGDLGAPVSWLLAARGLVVASTADPSRWLMVASPRATTFPSLKGQVAACPRGSGGTFGPVTAGVELQGWLVVTDGTADFTVVQTSTEGGVNGGVYAECATSSSGSPRVYRSVFGNISTIRSSGPYLYLATGNGVSSNGLEIWKLDEFSGEVRLVSATPTASRPHDVLPYGTAVYTTPQTGSGMQVYDVEP
ncbi:MAG: carboxypeptidase regulatory-like domain-containing protein [Myxococcota bacterium]